MNGVHPPTPSYAIVGSGVFGASTALHLIRKYPHASVTLIDREPFPCQVGASWDWNKVIRADYTDVVYMKLALEAKKLWRSDSIYKKWYHEDGMYWISDSNLAETVVNLYKQLGANEKYELMPAARAKALYGGLFADGDYTNVSDVLINLSSGWAEAKYCLHDVIQAAVDAGVNYKVATVATLEFNEKGSCTGLKTTAGDTIHASKIILSTGAGTAKLIADSAPDREEMQVGERMVAAAICTGLIKLSPEESERLQGPVCCQDVLPGRGGSIPPNPQRELKFWRDVPFKNTIKHSSGQLISSPPSQPNQDQWNVSQAMKDEVLAVNRGVFGNATKGLEVQDYRICWDAVTPNEDFIITAHPHSRNLYLATAGSFHGWKFLPILGKYVVQMLDGELAPDLAKLWAWDRDNGPNAYGDMWPVREMKDLYNEDAKL